MLRYPATILMAAVIAVCLLCRVAAAGPVQSVQRQDDGVVFSMDGAVMKLQVFSPRVIRVVYAQGTALPAVQSVSVIATPHDAGFDYSETADALVLKTAAVTARVERKSGAVSFSDPTGKVYLTELDGGGKSFAPSPIPDSPAPQSRQEFTLGTDEAIFGLGQHRQGVWNYRGKFIQLLQRNMEIGLPILISSRGYGLFWDNPAITTVEVGIPAAPNVVAWTSEAARSIDYYFMAGPDLDQVVGDYRELTGHAPLLGEWAYGFWQCKERYASQKELLDVVAQYRQRGTPIDGIIQDWRYWDPAGWGSHSLDPARYPDPAGMMEELHKENVHLIISVWARFDNTTDHYKELDAMGGLLDLATPLRGRGATRPGQAWYKFYDAFNPAARALYWKQINESLFKFGIDGWWLDATEPEIRDASALRHLNTGAGPGALVANAFPLMTTTGVYQGQRAVTSDKRVFILTRSAYPGQQRNSAVTWSGDINGDWTTLARQIPAGLNFSLCGIPYWNTDIGGFTSKPSPAYAELFTRWFQFGAFCPMFRVHGTNQPKEMWRFDVATDAILVKFDQLRYRLMPYIYSTAWQVTHGNDTLMRPLVMDFRTDPAAVNVADEFMFGRAILVNPVTSAGATSRKVYLPAGQDWFDFWTGKRMTGGAPIDAAAPIDSMPLYVKAGSIVPMGPVVNYAREKPDAPLEIRIYRGKDAAFTLYDDAGDGYGYEKGEYSEIPFAWNEAAGALTIGDRRGTYPGMAPTREFHLVWVNESGGAGLNETAGDVKVVYNGSAVQVAAPLPGIGELPVREAMPDVLTLNDGTKVTTTAQWKLRREEMKRILEYYAVGTAPPPPGNVTGKEIQSQLVAGGKVKYRLVRLTFGPKESLSLDIGIFTPVGGGKVPTLISPDGTPPGGVRLPRLPMGPGQGRMGLPPATRPTTGPAARGGRGGPGFFGRPMDAESIARTNPAIVHGYALVMFNNNDCGEDTTLKLPDGTWAFRTTRFYPAYPDYDWGLLQGWAWGVSRIVDYLQTDPEIDPTKLIVTGVSRTGKSALVAGAFDDRLAMVAPVASSGGGTPAYRFSGAEHGGKEGLTEMMRKYPNWFSPHLPQFSGHAEKLPFDEHWFIALAAPRPFIALEGTRDQNVNQNGVHQSWLAARPAFALLGVDDCLGVSWSDRMHGIVKGDWDALLAFADWHLMGKKPDRTFDQFPEAEIPKN